jgi:hypothetical protein
MNRQKQHASSSRLAMIRLDGAGMAASDRRRRLASLPRLPMIRRDWTGGAVPCEPCATNDKGEKNGCGSARA